VPGAQQSRMFENTVFQHKLYPAEAELPELFKAQGKGKG